MLNILRVSVPSIWYDAGWPPASHIHKLLGVRMHFPIGLAEGLIQDARGRTNPSFYVRVIVRQRDYLLLQTFYLTMQEWYGLMRRQFGWYGFLPSLFGGHMFLLCPI